MTYTPLEAVGHATILYAEDDPVARENVMESLEFFARKVLVAADGEEALALFEQETVHIVITDIHMPRMDGLALIKAIREKDGRIPVVVTSSYKDEATLLEAVRLYLTDYLVKPFSYQAMKKVLESCGEKMIGEGMVRVRLGKETWYDCFLQELVKGGKREPLTKRETLFLRLGLRNGNRLLTKALIEERVWEGEEMSDSALRSLLTRLRRKVGNDGLVTAIQDLGYLFRLPEEDA